MTTLTITTPIGINSIWLDRVNGGVCVDGSTVLRTGHHEAVLAYPDEFESLAGNGRQDLTPTEIATFVRNFLDEGFDDSINIK